jgi:hypothetical protein
LVRDVLLQALQPTRHGDQRLGGIVVQLAR